MSRGFKKMYIENLKKFRKEKNLTQKNIAEELELNRGTYLRYESGKRDIPTEYLIKLAKFYNKTTDELLGIKKGT